MARRSKYDNTIPTKLSLGASAFVRPGRSPGLEAAKGVTTSIRRGRSIGEASAKGAPLAVRRAKGGPLGYLGVGDPRGLDRFKLSEERNEQLNTPHYAKGGHTQAHRKAHKEIHSLYKMLHSHFAGDSEPESEPEPALEKKRGGRLWIKGAIKHKGALHKSLGVPAGKKIPISKLHQAEHSKSPTLRKRAKLADTLRGFHRNSRGR